VNWDVALKRLNAEMDREVAATKQPTVEKMEAAQEAMEKDRAAAPRTEAAESAKSVDETRGAYSQRFADLLVSVLVPSLDKAELLRRDAVFQDEMLNMIVAAARMHADTGAWPQRAEDMVPKYLKAVPKDIYSENGATDVGYMWNGDGVTATSVGRKKDPQGNGTRRPIELGVK
jgi:hypothetical protein